MGEHFSGSFTIHLYGKIFMDMFRELLNKNIVKYNDSLCNKMAYNLYEGIV